MTRPEPAPPVRSAYALGVSACMARDHLTRATELAGHRTPGTAIATGGQAKLVHRACCIAATLAGSHADGWHETLRRAAPPGVDARDRQSSPVGPRGASRIRHRRSTTAARGRPLSRPRGRRDPSAENTPAGPAAGLFGERRSITARLSPVAPLERLGNELRRSAPLNRWPGPDDRPALPRLTWPTDRDGAHPSAVKRGRTPAWCSRTRSGSRSTRVSRRSGYMCCSRRSGSRRSAFTTSAMPT